MRFTNFKCLIIFAFSLLGFLVSAINEDSLLVVINKTNTSQKDKLKAIGKLIHFYRRKDPAKTETYVKQYEAIYKTLKDTTEFSGIYHNILGFQLQYNGEQKNAIKHLEVAEVVFTKQKDYEALWGVYNNFGSAYQNIGNLTKSLEYYLKSINIGEKYLDEGATAGTAMNIGTIYAEQKMYPQALKYFRLSASVYSKIENSWGYGNDLNNIGQTYGLMNQLDSSEYYYKAALEVWDKMQDQQGQAMTYHNLGNLYGAMNKFSDAEKYFQKSLVLSYKMGDTYGITVNLSTISKLALSMGFKEKGLRYLNESVKYALENQLLGLQSENYELLYKVYKEEKNYKLALDFHEKFFTIYDSIHNKDNNKVLKEMQEKYESEKKQTQIDKQKLELTGKDLILSEQNRRSTIYISIIALFLIIIGFVFYQFKQKQKSNKIILQQKIEVEIQKEIVDEKNKEIIESITYAKRLQEAILPPKEFVNKYLTDNFILYKPKDLVAGDFYWAESVNDLFFIAAADSTGHGVPGAMVSVVCSNALNRSIKEFGLRDTGKILDKTRDLVLETFEKSTNEVKDGMDISLLCIDTKNRKVFWSGANNPLWYVTNSLDPNNVVNKELIEVKADKQSIGKTEHPKPFTTHQIEYLDDAVYYLFTDGYPDQFGGPKGKKYKYKQLKALLVDTQKKSLNEQKKQLEKSFDNWKGDLEQVDDICIIGIKI